jgi:hypothetical protein
MQSEFSAQSAGENEKPFFSDPSVYSVVNQNTPTISVFEIHVFTRFMTEMPLSSDSKPWAAVLWNFCKY